MKQSDKILVGIQEILDFIGVQDRRTFKTLYDEGLPARTKNRRWFAHKDRVEEFFYAWAVGSFDEFLEEEDSAYED